MTDDVVIVGAGPAGTVAATVLARAGLSVRIVDRETFPREKLCGDTVNPGTLAALRRLRLAEALDTLGLRVDGMRVTGERGVSIEGRYGADLCGRALPRSELDWALLQQAIAAGARFEPGVSVRRALVGAGSNVVGVVVGESGRERTLRARVTMAADGRRSAIAFGLGLSAHPRRPRRWAIGAYCAGVGALSSLGEMHLRRAGYVGVAPLPDGMANVCLVKSWTPADRAFGEPEALLRSELRTDPLLRDRFADARFARPPIVLGPLAVESSRRAFDGLLVAGDAAGFIDPMTGDGLRFAVVGAELAAHAACEALEHGWGGVHRRLTEARAREFSGKWRFNRALRALVASPFGLEAAAWGAAFVPSSVRAMIAYAGDCRAARGEEAWTGPPRSSQPLSSAR